MKLSTYNHYIELNDSSSILFYNAYTNSYLVLNLELYGLFEDNLNNINALKSKNDMLYQTLCKNGFIINDDIDEKNDYLVHVKKQRMATDSYTIVINPTLSCNLSCWYCYENHIDNSRLSPQIIDKIIYHIESKYNNDKFKELSIHFFGGEPFLYFDTIKEILLRVYKMSLDKSFHLRTHFTTNATLIKNEYVEFLKIFNPVFQITLDGNREQHDRIRVPNNKKPTYDKIIKVINYLSHQEGVAYVIVRINFSAQTFHGLSSILNDLEQCDRSKMDLRLFRIWQEDAEKIDNEHIFGFIKEAQSKLFRVEYLPLYYNTCGCYADNYNEAVINYDGKVFKCTARDFTNENSEGVLLTDGSIDWNEEKVNKRININIPKFCLNCKILPSCTKVCSQNLMEKGNKVRCVLGDSLKIEDFIIHNFNNKLISYHE